MDQLCPYSVEMCSEEKCPNSPCSINEVNDPDFECKCECGCGGENYQDCCDDI
jgi:hypothetical protein